MMQTFSRPGYKTQTAAAVGCFANNLMCVEIYPSFTGATDTGAAPALSKRSAHQNIELNIIGAALCERLLDARRQRRRRQCSNLSDDRVQAEVITALERSLPHSAMRECQDSVKRMEDTLFLCGGAERNVAMIRYFKDGQAIAEASVGSS